MNYGYCSQKKTQFSVTLTAFFCFCLVFFFFAVAFKSAPSYHLISSNSVCLVAPHAFPTHNRTDLGFEDFIDPLSLYFVGVYLVQCDHFRRLSSSERIQGMEHHLSTQAPGRPRNRLSAAPQRETIRLLSFLFGRIVFSSQLNCRSADVKYSLIPCSQKSQKLN